MFRGQLFLLVGFACFLSSSLAEPLSKKTDIDFFRDVPSRNLKGLGTRSDGRLVAGPFLVEIAVAAPADLLWCLEPTPDPAKWLVGTGAEGKIIEVTFEPGNATYAARDLAKLDDPQVFALKRLTDGSILAGTSPKGALYLVRDEAPVARTLLPVDSIVDLLLLDENTALAATGNPGRIYRIDLKQFAGSGINAEKIRDAKILAERGITLFGEIRDRNVRRIAALADGRIVAGSAPKGNVYAFPREGTGAASDARAPVVPATSKSKPAGAVQPPPPSPGSAAKAEPVILQENKDAEVTDLLPQPNGDLYATIVYSTSTGETRITPIASTKSGRDGKEEPPPPPPPAQVERFAGRSALIWFPADGFPETLAARPNTAFYRIARHGDVLIVAGGEQGELIGYDLKARLSLTFAGSISSQLNSIAPLTGAAGKFLVLRNNAPGLALLDFNATGPREAETRRLDLGTPARLGALRFNRLRNLSGGNLVPELRTSNGSDEVEGWGPWTPLNASDDAGWRADGLRGRYAKLRLRIAGPENASGPPSVRDEAGRGRPFSTLEIDRATIYSLPQNRRPLLQDFRVLTPGYSIIPAAEQPPPASVTLSQTLQGPKDDDRRKGNFLSSQVVPSPGAQVVTWTVVDPDGDNLVCTFSIRREDNPGWTDVAAATRDSYAQFDTAHLPDGVYFTRLVATETAPRPRAERLVQTFETDDLVVDHTPPEAIEATAIRVGESVVVTVRGRDRLSLLDGIEVIFNNGVREIVEQPADGVRDGREETFRLDVPLAKVSNATSLEVTLFDVAGNGTARRLTW
ncbi:MAG: hypothetical protein HY736_28040 [Verrucomicrobia bacterium]|nr:hypothetical protein [Verrucomicrobiota bacterium]